MTDTLTAQFILTKREMAEGITHASATLLRPWQRWATSLWTTGTALMAGIAALSITMVAAPYSAGLVFGPILPALALLLAGMTVLLHSRVVLGWMATRALSLKDPSGTQIEINADGLHFTSTHENSHLGWPAVHSIILGKTALLFNISGATFVLPKRVLPDPKATLDQVQKWKAAHA